MQKNKSHSVNNSEKWKYDAIDLRFC